MQTAKPFHDVCKIAPRYSVVGPLTRRTREELWGFVFHPSVDSTEVLVVEDVLPNTIVSAWNARCYGDERYPTAVGASESLGDAAKSGDSGSESGPVGNSSPGDSFDGARGDSTLTAVTKGLTNILSRRCLGGARPRRIRSPPVEQPLRTLWSTVFRDLYSKPCVPSEDRGSSENVQGETGGSQGKLGREVSTGSGKTSSGKGHDSARNTGFRERENPEHCTAAVFAKKHCPDATNVGDMDADLREFFVADLCRQCGRSCRMGRRGYNGAVAIRMETTDAADCSQAVVLVPNGAADETTKTVVSVEDASSVCQSNVGTFTTISGGSVATCDPPIGYLGTGRQRSWKMRRQELRLLGATNVGSRDRQLEEFFFQKMLSRGALDTVISASTVICAVNGVHGCVGRMQQELLTAHTVVLYCRNLPFRSASGTRQGSSAIYSRRPDQASCSLRGKKAVCQKAVVFGGRDSGVGGVVLSPSQEYSRRQEYSRPGSSREALENKRVVDEASASSSKGNARVRDLRSEQLVSTEGIQGGGAAEKESRGARSPGSASVRFRSALLFEPILEFLREAEKSRVCEGRS